MLFAPVILSLTIIISCCIAWFGLIQGLNCSHQADRKFFVGLTTQLHQQERKDARLDCQGRWFFIFEKKSIHVKRNLSLELEDWGIPNESKR